ncbi:unnamed protein product [Effrenium voratum]|nr:unnamed protein product [Effrenium voratum]
MRELERRKKELMMGEMGLAHRFISFAMKLLNDDLQEFYSRCLPIFDQEAADLQNHGHTHEQHAAFQEYTSMIEARLLEFCHQEGFGQDAQALFNELQRLLQKDQQHVAEHLQRVLADVERRKAELRSRAQDEGETEQPLVLICKPAALSDLMNSLIQQLEYQSFSASMRYRVEQGRLMKAIMADLAKPAGELPPPPGDLEVVDVEEECQSRPAIGTMSLTVPEGCEVGSQMSITGPDGQPLCVTVPGGLSPGMAFEVPCCGYSSGYSVRGDVPPATTSY